MILKPKTNSFDLLRYSGDNFHLVKANITDIKFDPKTKMPENVKFSFGYFDKNREGLSIVLVSEEFNEENMTYNRYFDDYFVTISTKKKKVFFVQNTNQSIVDHFKNISNTLELIGAFVTNESDIILFFRIDSTIKYCSVDEVNTYLFKICV